MKLNFHSLAFKQTVLILLGITVIFVAHPCDDWIFKESLHSLAGVAKRLGQGDAPQFDDITMLALKFVGKT